MKEITVATVIDFDKPITIPIDWVKLLSSEHRFAVLLKNNPSMFRLITTAQDSITEYYLDLETLEENFLELLFKSFENMNLKPIYSSGVCFVDETCYYLFLLDGYHSEEQVNKVRTTFEKIKGIKNIDVKFYQVDK